MPVEISGNLDKLNTSSGYFKDICYTATSDSGTDIILKDRKKEFIEKNKMVCPDDCDFTEYNFETKKARCSCKVKEVSSSFKEMNINKDKFFINFIDIKNIANLNLLICYKSLFLKNGIIYKIGSYIIILIIIIHIINIFIFYIKQLDIILSKIKYIMNNIKNNKVKLKNINKVIIKENKIIQKDNKLITTSFKKEKKIKRRKVKITKI